MLDKQDEKEERRRSGAEASHSEVVMDGTLLAARYKAHEAKLRSLLAGAIFGGGFSIYPILLVVLYVTRDPPWS